MHSATLRPADPTEQTAPIDLNVVTSDLHGTLLAAVEKDVSLSLSLASGIDLVRVDRARYERLLVGLVVNAAKAIDGQGRVTVETRLVTLATVVTQRGASLPPGRYVVIAVTDTGRGMTPHARQRLFEPPPTGGTGATGAGPGLSYCDAIVREAGGLIFVDSELGAGTAFTILLPVAEGDAVPPVSAGGNKTILLIDDSAGVRTLVRRILERLGYRVVEASSGTEALALTDALEAPIDLVLCDVILPDGTGAEIVRQIQGRVPGVRSLFMSGHTVQTLPPKAQLPEGAAFIHKPFERPVFAQKIREVLCG